MHDRHDTQSEINFLLFMDDAAQVVPICDDAHLQGRGMNLPFQTYLDSNNTINCGMIPSTVLMAPEYSLAEKSDDVQQNSAQKQNNLQYSPQNVFENFKNLPCDKALMDATNEALVNGSLMPLIKEELKYSIQSKRLKHGKGEMKVEFKEPEPDILTEEELEKVDKRRVQNREAARRFRTRQKDRGDVLQKECQKLESFNTQLRYELSQLRKERDNLRSTFEQHMQTCPMRQPASYCKLENQGENT